MGAPVCNCVKISQNLPASHNFHFPAKNRRDNLSNWRNFIYESNNRRIDDLVRRIPKTTMRIRDPSQIVGSLICQKRWGLDCT